MKLKIVLMSMMLVLMSCLSIAAESEIEVELGSSEEFEAWINSDAAVMSTLNFVRRIAVIDGMESRRYFTLMQIDGQLVYCIEPNVMAGTWKEYEVDWSVLSEEKKQRLFQLTNVGYLNYGHDDDRWFVATQLAIWRALGYTQYSAKTFDDEPMDLSWEIAEIERMADCFASKASFSGQTLELDLNVPVSIEDKNGVLTRFKVNNQKGVMIHQDNNKMDITITDLDYDPVLSDSVGILTGGLVYGRPGYQKVYMVHRSQAPASYDLRLKLRKNDILIHKRDSFGNPASGQHVFEIKDAAGKTLIQNIVVSDGSLILPEVLPLGAYVLKECSTVYPYQLCEQELVFTVNDQKKTELNFVNEFEEIPVAIIKKDSDTNELLDGAHFVISKMNQEGKMVDVQEGITKDGKLEVNGLRYGDEIQVCEVKAPEGYELSENRCQSLQLKPMQKEIVQIEFMNRRLDVPIEIIKKDSETGELLDGAHFVISKMNHEGKMIEVQEGITKDGKLEVNGLRYGDQIQVCEVKAPEGYELSESSCQTAQLSMSKSNPVTFVFENQKRQIMLKVVKRDADTTELLNDAVFEISLYDEKRQEWILLSKEKTGRRLLKVDSEMASQDIEIYADQELSHQLGSAQADSSGIVDVTGIVYQDIVFIEDTQGNRWQKQVDDNPGVLEIKGKYGDKIRLCEVKAPLGYQIPEQPCHEIELIGETDELVYTVENQIREIEVFIYKKDAENHQLLNDAFLSIENEHHDIVYGLSGRFYLSVKDEWNQSVSVKFDAYSDKECTNHLFSGKTDASGEYISASEEMKVYVKLENQDEPIEVQVNHGGVYYGKVHYGEKLKVCEVIAPSGYERKTECEWIEVNNEEDTVHYDLYNNRIHDYEEVPTMGIV